MSSITQTPERPKRTGTMPSMAAPRSHQNPSATASSRGTAVASISTSAATAATVAVTPSPYVVNRAEDRASSSAAKGTRLDFANTTSDAQKQGNEEGKDTTSNTLDTIVDASPPHPSTPKRQHEQHQTTIDELLQTEHKKKKAKVEASPPPKPTEAQAFKSHTVYPSNKTLSTEDQVKALSHLRTHVFAAETLHLRTNDLVVTTQSLGDNVPVGTTGKVVGWTSIEDVRLGLGSHIQELRSLPVPDKPEHQQEFEIDVTHKHAVDIMPAPWYPDVLFHGLEEEEEGTVLPEAFTDIVPGVGTMIRCQLPLLRVPHCRCRPAAPVRLLRCHNHGPNHGRWFFGCSRPIGEQCGYFVWKTSKQGGVKKEETK
mmetsp:Transcript_19203/g.41520  ORF Transcript_19203/g.41520 Transcript_19203/m.41520 type:complete len:370 (+) Transcript_19203:75-1184(+)